MSVSGGERAGLLAAVKEQPRERAPRLVLADWLEEHSEGEADLARAELIRLHCEPRCLHLGHFERDRGPRQKELLARYRSSWLGPLDSGELCWEIRGGLVDLVLSVESWNSVCLLLEPLARAGPEAWAWLDELRLRSLPQTDLDYPPQEPLPAGFASLNLGFNHLGTDRSRLLRLAGWPLLREVSALLLFVNALGAEGILMLLPALAGGKVRVLNLGNNQLEDAGLARLADSEILEQLTSLDLYGNRIGDEGIRRLLTSPHCRALRSLDLSFNNIRAEGLRAAASTSAELIDLDLESNPLGEEGARQLASAAPLRSLGSLKLRRTNLGPGGVRVLAESANFPVLRALDLAGCFMEEEGVRLLARSGPAAGLEYLSLEDNGLDPEATAILAGAESFGNLCCLRLGGNRLGDVGVRLLARSPLAAGLTELDLRKNEISATGAAALADSPYLRSLRVLYVGGNPLRRGCHRLADRFGPALNLDDLR
jgi:uncharacterized protein (TIGR02996 family)